MTAEDPEDDGSGCVIVRHDPPERDALAVLADHAAADGLPTRAVIVLRRGLDRAFRIAALRAGAMEVVEEEGLDEHGLAEVEADAVARFEKIRRAVRQDARRATRLRRVFETNLLGILFWNVKGAVHDANDEFLRMIGYDREDLAAGRIDWAKMTPPEHRAQDTRAVEELNRTGRHAPIEKEFYKKDGGRVWVLVGSTYTEGEDGVGFVLDISRQKETEDALRRSETAAHEAAERAEHERSILDAILDAAPAAIIVASAGGKLVRFNPANELLWGPAPFSDNVDEYREWKGWWADGSERHGRRVRPEEWAMSRALRGETVRDDVVEVEPFGQPGVRHTMVNSGAPVRDAHGDVVGAIVAQMDISALVAAQSALRESEARFRDLADNIAQLAWMADETGYIFWYNRRWFEYTGTTLELMQGWGWQTVHHEDHVARVRRKFSRHLASGEPWEDTFPLRRKDGEFRWFLSRAIPIRDADGKVIRWFGTNTDITEQRAAEEAAKKSEELLRTTMDNFPTVIAFKDTEGRFLDVNHVVERVLGVPAARIRGRTMYDFVPKAAADVLRQHELHVMQSRRAMQFEETTPLETGTLFHVDSNFPLIAPDGTVYGTGHISHDVTQLKNAEAALRALNERLQEADRRKDQFIAILAHELRNPLAPVRNAVEILRRAGPDARALSRARDVVDRNVTHMARLIDDLLDVSRVTRGKLALHKERCDLTGIVRQTAEDYRSLFEAGDVALTVDAGQEPLWVDGDPVRLAQMVGNLLHNAARFTNRGGGVEVRALRDGGSARVVVADSGVGIEPRLLSRLFDPFSQADQDLARSKGGLGLGLALTKGLAELHGGNVVAESLGAGKGSTFSLRLPLADARAAGVEEPATTDRTSGLRIVLVEDNQDAAETMAELLELGGHHVKVTFDGMQGVAAARELHPDVVISDIGLPGSLDGYGVAQVLRAEPSLAGTYLIALSGYAHDEARRRSHEAGFDLHFAKPPDLGKLERALAGVARR